MIKLKREIVFVVTLLFGTIYFISCDKVEEISSENQKIQEIVFIKKYIFNKKESNYDYIFRERNNKIRLISYIKDGNLSSNLLNLEDNKWEKYSSILVLDFKDIESKKNINKLIEKEAERIKYLYSYETLIKIKNLLQDLPEKLFLELNREYYYNEANLSLFYHLAIFNTAIRSIDSSNKTCNCGMYDKSLNEKTPFFCSEDKLVSKESILVLLSEMSKNNLFEEKTFIPNQTIKYISISKKNIFQASDVDRILRKEFNIFWHYKLSEKERENIFINENGDRKVLPPIYDVTCILYGAYSGGDCGCCGNYSGICHFCHIACYLHDLACEDCGWGCGWACVPGPC